MRLARILSLVVLVAVLFVTVDLGISCLGALVPGLQDGIPYYSLLQRWFGVWKPPSRMAGRARRRIRRKQSRSSSSSGRAAPAPVISR